MLHILYVPLCYIKQPEINFNMCKNDRNKLNTFKVNLFIGKMQEHYLQTKYKFRCMLINWRSIMMHHFDLNKK